MVSLRLPTFLRSYTNGQREVQVEGGTVAAALDNLVRQYPAIQPQIYNKAGNLRPFVNLFIGEENIKQLSGLETILEENDTLMIVANIAGG